MEIRKPLRRPDVKQRRRDDTILNAKISGLARGVAALPRWGCRNSSYIGSSECRRPADPQNSIAIICVPGSAI
jgi:hypothetical protein